MWSITTKYWRLVDICVLELFAALQVEMAAVNSKKIDEIDGYVLSDETLSDDDSGDGESEENYLDVSDLEVLTQPSSPIEGKSLKRKIC